MVARARLIAVIELARDIGRIVSVQHRGTSIAPATIIQCPNDSIVKAVGRNARSCSKCAKLCRGSRAGAHQTAGEGEAFEVITRTEKINTIVEISRRV